MEVYVVTCGDYSDYHIEQVFTNYEKAAEYVALRNRNPNGYQYEWNIEWYSTYDDALEGEIKVYYLYAFSFRDGIAKVDNVRIVGYQKKEFSRYCFGSDWLVGFELTLEEEDEEKALKIAQDEYAKMRATEF